MDSSSKTIIGVVIVALLAAGGWAGFRYLENERCDKRFASYMSTKETLALLGQADAFIANRSSEDIKRRAELESMHEEELVNMLAQCPHLSDRLQTIMLTR